MEDHKIVEMYLARDEDAIRETESKYGRLCYQIAYNILGIREDAEECVSDTYIGIWNAIPPARPDFFRAFMCKIVRNLSLKRLAYLQQKKRLCHMEISLEELEAVLPDYRYVPEITDEEVGQAIERFLRIQKQDSRSVFIRRYYFFDSVAEIAKRYSYTESKVKNMLHHTRKKLREYLVEEGIAL